MKQSFLKCHYIHHRTLIECRIVLFLIENVQQFIYVSSHGRGHFLLTFTSGVSAPALFFSQSQASVGGNCLVSRVSKMKKSSGFEFFGRNIIFLLILKDFREFKEVSTLVSYFFMKRKFFFTSLCHWFLPCSRVNAGFWVVLMMKILGKVFVWPRNDAK